MFTVSECNLGKVKLEPMPSVDLFTAANFCAGVRFWGSYFLNVTVFRKI